MTLRTAAAPLVALLLASCASSAVTSLNESTICGDGTHANADGTCVPDCGSGTHRDAGRCVPDAAATGLTCGTGTHAVGHECVPLGTAPSCGTGTHLSGGSCVADDAAVPCGAGTHESSGECVPDATSMTCGAGTAASGTTCLPVAHASGATYEIRVATTHIPADGFSTIPVLVIGTAADGSPSLERVVISTSRAGAGNLTPPAPTLSPLGAAVSYVPCSAATPGCAGPVQLVLALASAPTVVIATSATLQLEAPLGIGSAAACLLGGNILVYNGDAGDYIFPGHATITQGAWSAQGGGSDLTIHVTPSAGSQGLWWDLEFSSRQLGQPLAAQVYEHAERAPFASPGHPGIDIGGDGRGCNEITGRFQIEDIAVDNGSLTSFTATFEQHCEGGVNALRGCVHYEK